MRKSRRFILLFLLVLLVVGFPFFLKWNIDKFFRSFSHHEVPSALIGASYCGPLALQVICMFFGIPSTVDELGSLAQTDITGTTVKNLCYAAQQKGLSTTMVKWSIEDLKASDSPVIAFVDRNHFLVVESFENGQFRLWDSPQASTWVSEQVFMQRWEGHTVLFDLAFTQEGPRIAFDRAIYDFGQIMENEKIHHTFPVHNIGNADLQILKVQSSCRCTTMSVKEKTISPGETGYISTMYDSRGYSGKAEETLTVMSNDLTRPTTVLTVSGFVQPIPRALPETLFVQASSTEQVKKILIQLPSGQPVKILSAVSNVSGITATVIQTNNQATITVHIGIRALDGVSDAKIVIHTDSSDTPRIEVPIVRQEVTPIVHSPKQFLFGSVKVGEQRVREVHLLVDEPSQFMMERIEKRSPFLSVGLEVDESETTSFILRTTLNASVAKGALKDTIKLYVNYHGNPMEISIPVYALVLN